MVQLNEVWDCGKPRQKFLYLWQTNAWIYIQYWCIYYVISWGYDNIHSGYQFSSRVNTGFKLNCVPATAKMWCLKGNKLKVKFPADREHNTLLLWNKHCIFWMCTYSHKNVLTKQPTPCSRVQLQKRTVAQLVWDSPFYGTWRFVTTFAHHMSLSWARWIKSMSSYL